MSADYWIEKLQLNPHPEGGYYKETYRCKDSISFAGFSGQRSINTAIYFLLQGNAKSHFHRIKSDELWFFHAGSSLEIFYISEEGTGVILLGNNPDEGEVLQAVIPAGYWFGAKVKDKKSYTLVSCTVAPGFDFQDFDLANKADLLREFPTHADLINDLSLR